MFDKENYWRYRKAGLRVPGAPAPRFYPKGTDVEYTTREDNVALYPNDAGGHMARVRGKLTFLNRKDSRRKSVSRHFTKPNHGTKGLHAVNDPKQDDYRRDGLTNYQRVIRQRSLSGRVARDAK